MNLEQQESITTADVGNINDINFTSRELDIIACLLAGRAAKKTATVLLISPRTVEIHLRNIMQKIGCNSRESIIDFVEKSDKFMLIKKHYAKLLIQSAFGLELQKLHRSLKKTNISCVIFYCKKQRAKDNFIAELEKHLNIAGIKTISKAWGKHQTQNFIASQTKIEPITWVIYAISNEFIAQLQTTNHNIAEEAVNLTPMLANPISPIVFLELTDQMPSTLKEQLANFTCINFTTDMKYYAFVLKILTVLLPTHNIAASITAFNNQSALLTENTASPSTTPNIPTTNLQHLSNTSIKTAIVLAFAICFGFMFFTANPYNLLSSKDKNSAVSTGSLNKNKTTIRQKLTATNTTIIQAQQLKAKANVWPIQKFHSQLAINPVIALNLPPRNIKFSGRNKALQQINHRFTQPTSGNMTQIISGLGGVGKTQLATEFAYQAVAEHIYSAILWITAATPNAINNAYREFANTMQLDIRGLKPNEVSALVHNKLTELPSGSKVLFVLDNVPNYADIQEYLATLHKQLGGRLLLHTLVTSRSQYWADTPIILDAFSSNEALLFVKNHLPSESEAAILRLTKTLHYFPLALGQAVAYIKAHTNIDDYLELYQAREKDYLDLFAGEKTQYTESLWKTWYIALAKLNTNAKKVLFLAAYLDPDNIPISLFDNLSTADRVNAIEELRRHSFIILTNNNKSFKIHRLLQEIIRLNIQGITLLEESWLVKTIELIQHHFTYDYIHCEKWDLYKQYLPHVIAVAEHAVATKNPAFQVGLKLYCQIAMFMTYIQADITEAVQMWAKILTLIEKHNNKEASNISIANINTHLGYITFNLGDIGKSNEYLNNAISRYKQPTTSKQDQTLIDNLRLIQLNNEVSLLDRTKYDLCFALIRLGNRSRATGQYDKAIKYYDEALTTLQTSKPNIAIKYYSASILRELGAVHIYSGNFVAAENMLIEAKQIVDQTFINHPLQLYTHEGLAALLYNIGEFKQAKQILDDSLKTRLTLFSKLHFGIAHTYMLLGGVNAMLANITLAEHNLQQAEQIYNVHHKNSYYCYIFLYLRFSRVYEALHQYDKALAYLEKTLKLAATHYGPELHTAMSFQLSAAETWPTAIKNANIAYLEKALAITMQLFGKQHIQTARYHYLLGLAYSAQHKNNLANAHYKKAIAIVNAQPNTQHPNLLKVRDHNLKLINKHLN